MKGDDGKRCEKPEDLDMDEHPSSLACGERRLNSGS
jgi:hypothetical protein